MSGFFNSFRLVRDFGVTALILTLMVLIMGVGGLWLVRAGDQEFALAWVAILLQPTIKVLEVYIQKRNVDKADGRTHHKGGGNSG